MNRSTKVGLGDYNHANLALKFHPIFIPHKFWILEFGIKVFCQFNKKG